MLQSVDQNLHRTGNFTLGIGVLNTQKQYALALVRHPFGGQTLHQIAQMDKAGRGGSHTGDHRTLRIVTGRELCFHLFRGLGYIGV